MDADGGFGYGPQELGRCLSAMGEPYVSMDEREIERGLLRMFDFGHCAMCGRWDTLYDEYCIICDEERGDD